ncbi:MAG: type II toxin-antitoxin system Phd/YefM family antitoxin [Anaeroplasmataceae bacterium]
MKMQIIPIKDLRDTNKISDLCNETNEPIFVTKNGYGDMVVMSIKTYEEKLERIEMYEAILEGLSNIEEGKVKDGEISLQELKTKYDL